MNHHDLLALAKTEAEPSVSVLVPTHPSATSHDADLLRARQLIDEAAGIVDASHTGPDGEAVRQRLHDVAGELDLHHPGEGLAVFVNASEQHVLHVPFPVDEQVTVNTAFSMHQLFAGMARRPPVRILVLSEHLARLFDSSDGQLVESVDASFPLTLSTAHEQNAPHHDLPIHEGSKAEEHRIVYRAVDAALDALPSADSAPLVLVGATRELAYFEEVSHHGRRVVGQVPKNLTRAPLAEIEQAARPVIDAYAGKLEDEAVSQVLEGIGTGATEVDVPTLWQASIDGRGRRLVVEEGYELPAFDTSTATAATVDELIAHVVLAGGDIAFVSPGRLDRTGGIGLLLRY